MFSLVILPDSETPTVDQDCVRKITENKSKV